MLFSVGTGEDGTSVGVRSAGGHMSTSAGSAGMRPGGVATSVSTSAGSVGGSPVGVRIPECLFWLGDGDGVRIAAGLSSRDGAVGGTQPGVAPVAPRAFLTYLVISVDLGSAFGSAPGSRASSVDS